MKLARRNRRGWTHPRIILLAAVVFILINTGLYCAAPSILPVRIIEGPLIQQATETGATLVCFTTRAATLDIDVDGLGKLAAETTGDTRHVFRVTGLTSGGAYPYRILTHGRELSHDKLHTNRTASQSFRFVAFGDSGRGTRDQYALVKDMIAAEPDFLLHAGDLVYPDGDRKRYNERFFAPYRELLSKVPFWPCLGNHDFDKPAFGASYRSVFVIPENGPPNVQSEHNYWFDYGAARIVVIDSDLDEDTLRDAVAPWVTQTFAAAPEQIRWRLVSFHHPPYSAGKYAPGNTKIRTTLVPALEASSVDLVFNGHDHNYQRTTPLRGGQPTTAGQPGVVYVVTGEGGAELYPLAPKADRPSWLISASDNIHSFSSIEISGDKLTLRQIALGGDVLDEFTLQKTTPPAQESLTSTPASLPTTSPAPIPAGQR